MPRPQITEINAENRVIHVCSDHQQLGIPNYLALDCEGRVFVAGGHKHRVLLLNSYLELERILLDTQQHHLDVCPNRLCYVQQTAQLCVGN